jgi:hypothetical protein
VPGTLSEVRGARCESRGRFSFRIAGRIVGRSIRKAGKSGRSDPGDRRHGYSAFGILATRLPGEYRPGKRRSFQVLRIGGEPAFPSDRTNGAGMQPHRQSAWDGSDPRHFPYPLFSCMGRLHL